MREESTPMKTQRTGSASTSSAYRIFGSIARLHFRFSISAAAPVTFSTSVGFSVTKDSGSILAMNPSFAAPPSSSACAVSLRESIRKHRYLILERSLISSPATVSVSIASHAVKTENGSSGRPPIGNFSSPIFGHDSSSLMDDSFWNSIEDRTALHFLLRNYVLFFSHKAHASFVGKRCWQRIQIDARDSRCCSRRPVGDAPQRVIQLRATFRTAKRLQLP